ncbi:MAG: hypothetical protein LBQ12_03920 [Deltaproteobacteria bacterium]|nr:hypothetical protein [Deltaproteobacteria bacterium]
MPETGRDTAFLKGCWRSDAAVEDVRTGWPLRFTFCFGARGQGALNVDETGPGGKVFASCEARAAATLSKGRLEIRAGAARCPGTTRSYAETTLVCVAGKDASECFLRGDGGAPVPARLTRVEGKG